MTHSNLPFARQLMENALREMLAQETRPESANFPAWMNATEAAMVLQFDDLAHQFQQAAGKFKVSWWMRFMRSDEFKRRREAERYFWRIVTTEKAIQAHPFMDENYWQTYLDRHPEKDFELAFQNAKSEYDRECVLLTQLVEGRFEQTLAARTRLSEDFRVKNVLLIAMIESYRQARLPLAEELFNTYPDLDSVWYFKPNLALGSCGFAPWCGYPYPDY